MSASHCEGCGKEAPSMQCPKCKELSLTPSYFCGQACFKESWGKHKVKHTTEKPLCTIETMTQLERQMFNFRGPLRPHLITPRRHVPAHIPRPDHADTPDGASPAEESDRGSKAAVWKGADLDKIRRVCKLSREVLDIACAAVKPGVTTDEIDRLVHEETIKRGMYPSPLNYYNFPKSVCTSVNEIICHGIPDARPLEDGDIVNIDVSCYLDGFHGDLNETVFVGTPDETSVRLVHCTYEAMMAGIKTVEKGALYKHVGDAIEARAALDGFGVVRTYSGHGVGKLFHTSPSISHYANNKSTGIMQIGHVFTIEPMINVGTWRDVTWPDRWTSSTMDGLRSAQFEHCMVVTDKGYELFTDWNDGVPTYQKQLKALGIPLPKPRQGGSATAGSEKDADEVKSA
jgi:methionyl aminopeptidase